MDLTPRAAAAPSRMLGVLTALALLPAAAQLIVAVHELGHALAALALGGTIEELRINFLAGKPHVQYSGLPDGARALVTAAGPGLTLLAWLAWLLAARRPRSIWHRELLFIGGVGALFPLLLWSVLPLLHAAGRRVRDDSVTFVVLTGASPYAVSAIALALLAACVWLLLRRIDVREVLRAQLPPLVSPRVHALLCIAVLLLAVIAFAAR